MGRIGGMYDRIDHVQMAVADLDAAAEPLERLGLRLTPPSRNGRTGTENRVFFAGEGRDEFYVELVAVADEDVASTNETGLRVLRYLNGGGGLKRVLLHTSGLAGEVVALAKQGLRVEPYEFRADDGRLISTAASLNEAASLGVEVGLVQYPEALEARQERHRQAGYFDHSFPLKRMDHLAALVEDGERTAAEWERLLGIEVAGEIRTSDIVIKQLRVGDGVLELLAPGRPDAPIASRPRGLLSMVAFEVEDLAGAVALARERGFNVSEAEAGVIPGSRRATIPGSELSGLAVQLLEYE